MNADPVPAISTNSDLYAVPMTGGQPRKITSTPGADSSPRYSPDGKYIAWRAQFRAGYESDRWRLMVLERATGKRHQPHREPGPLGQQLHLGAGFRPRLFFTIGDRGRQAIQMIPVTGGARAHRGERRQRTGRHAVDARRQDHGLHRSRAACRRSRSIARLFGRRAGGADASERCGAERATRLTPLEEFWVDARRWLARAELRRQAVRLRGRPQVSGAVC